MFLGEMGRAPGRLFVSSTDGCSCEPPCCLCRSIHRSEEADLDHRTSTDRRTAALATPPGRPCSWPAHTGSSGHPATRTGQPRRAPHPPETSPRRTHSRVLRRRLTAPRCHGRTHATTPNRISEPPTMPLIGRCRTRWRRDRSVRRGGLPAGGDRLGPALGHRADQPGRRLRGTYQHRVPAADQPSPVGLGPTTAHSGPRQAPRRAGSP